MLSKRIILLMCVGCISTAALAADINWAPSDASQPQEWGIASNWDLGVPTSADAAWIGVAGAAVEIPDGESYAIAGARIGEGAENSLYVGEGASLTSSAAFYIARSGAASIGTVEVDGTLNVPPRITLSAGPDADGNLIVNDGGTVTSGLLLFGDWVGTGFGRLIMNGGLVDVDQMGAWLSKCTVTVDLNDGVYDVGFLNPAVLGLYDDPEGSLSVDIDHGTWILSGDKRADISTMISRGELVGYGGAGEVVYDYGISNAGKTTVTATNANNAYNASPPAGSTEVNVDVDLSWSIPGSLAGAVSNVYFGTSPNPPLVSSEQTGATYDPGTLDYRTDYYWRIDLVHEGTTYPGNEWTFKTTLQVTDLQGMIDDQLAQGSSTVTIDPGRYYVAPSGRRHLRFQDLNNVTIVMDGVEMVCTETTQAIYIQNCTNLTIQGLTIDYDPLPYTQGVIQSLSQNNTVHEIELFDGYPSSEGVIDSKYEIFDPATRTLRWGSYFTFSHEKIDSRHIRVTREGTYKGEQIGDIIVINNRYAPGGSIPHGIQMKDSESLTLQDITLYGSNSFGFFESNCNGTHYLRCKVDRRPLENDLKVRADARIRSLDADAFHSKHAIVGPTLEECTAKFQGDDCLNITGDYHMITECNGQTLRVLAKSSMNIQVGDPVELWSYTGMRLLPDAVAVQVSGPVGEATAEELQFLSQQSMHAPYKEGNIGSAYEIQIDRAIDVPMGSLIAAANRIGNGFQVINCDFGFNRSRGILIKASNGIVQGNVIEGTWGAAIKCSPEFWWLEAGCSWNVTFSDNIIKNCVGDGIAVYAQPGAGGVSPAGAHGDIVLRNNTITNVGDPHIWVTSTKGLILDGNTYDTILLENCEDVTLAGDFDGNGGVDLFDLQMMAADWLEVVFSRCPQCDFNADGDINLEDYSVLSRNWLQEL